MVCKIMIKSALRYSPIPIGVIIAVCLLAIGIISATILSQTKAFAAGNSREKLITIHDRGGERVILSNAATLQDALDEAKIVLDDRDAVEPSLAEELVESNYYVNIYRARPVVVSDGHVREKIMTPYQTADKIAEDAGLKLQDEDTTTLKPTEDIISEGAGLQLIIDRATPFTFVLYGNATQAYSQATTVGEMLIQKHISLGPNDQLSVNLDTPLTAGMTVDLWRNGKQTVTEEKDIPFTTEKIQDAAHEIGYKEVRTPGVNGKRSVVYEVDIQNGREVSRKEAQSIVLVEPKKQVEVIGTKRKTFGGSCDDWIASAGITDLANAHYLITKESNCNPYAINKSSGACGIGQALPCSKMKCEMGDGACQVKWMNDYVIGRYGSWQAAADHHRRKGWY